MVSYLVLFILLLTSCNITVGPSRVVTGTRLPLLSETPKPVPNTTCRSTRSGNPALDIACRNTDLINEFRDAREWQYHQAYYTSKKESPPRFCVAFSGGGIRSAAFAVGILKGLESQGLINKIDIFSATSGGSYAVSWYYMQQFRIEGRDNRNRRWIFEQPLENLYQNASFVSLPQYLFSAGGDIVLSPVNLLANMVFGLHLNTSWFGKLYDWQIKRTFHNGMDATFGELHDILQPRQLPLFIITATARIEEDQHHHDALSAASVFEFTPLRWGSDAFTYRPIDKSFSIQDAVAVAGSAPDSTQVFYGASQRVVYSALNLDTGRFIPNDFRSENERSIWRKLTYLLPFPFYLPLPRYTRDAHGDQIYLSDGGHQDNFAVFPLIRRLCENIIVVDGEYDPDYTFDGLQRFKHQVEHETGAAVRFYPRADDETGGQDLDSHDAAAAEHLIGSRRDWDTTGNQLCAPGVSCDGRPKQFNPRWPVIGGTIGPFPIVDEHRDLTYKVLHLAYVKLSLDTKRFHQGALTPDARRQLESELSPALVDFYLRAEAGKCGDLITPCDFPQLSTFWQSFSADRFRAYVDLGAAMIKNHLQYDFGAGTLRVDK